MKRFNYFIVLAVMAACSSINVSYDYDKTADFTKYKTYNFTEEALKLPIQELNRNRLLAAVEKELADRGFTKSSSPDVFIDIQITAKQEQSATATNTGGGYGYGRAYRYGGGMTTTQINVETYVVGTLFINMVANNSLVWQGRGEKTLDESASPEQKEKNINYGVSLIFKKYPIQPTKK